MCHTRIVPRFRSQGNWQCDYFGGAAGPMLQLVNAHGQTIILRLEEVIELYDNLTQMIERLEGEK